ncbi:hypothetical protein [Krasilnikovia sp. MM14-A1004]|uniref:hypothetical protein n=1 Tax=Krasilnikovia sp. MM14-A1004 TaxID=3373541 RepID=UPI00399C746A
MDVSELPSRYDSVDARIPRSWGELRGPAAGRVRLPLRLAWSGPDTFDVSNPRQRLTLYSILLDCGQRADAAALMHPELLRQSWPHIRRLTTREITDRWERRLPGLRRVA